MQYAVAVKALDTVVTSNRWNKQQVWSLRPTAYYLYYSPMLSILHLLSYTPYTEYYVYYLSYTTYTTYTQMWVRVDYF